MACLGGLHISIEEQMAVPIYKQTCMAWKLPTFREKRK